MTISGRDNAHFRLLLAAIVTSWLTGLCFTLDIYPGAPFGPDWAMLTDVRMLTAGALFMIIPAGLFALFAVWPLLLLITPIVRAIETRSQIEPDWFLWMGSGVLLGPLALFAYSFPLGLGQTLIVDLVLNGMVSGGICAALTRWLIGAEVGDMPIVINAEAPDNLP